MLKYQEKNIGKTDYQMISYYVAVESKIYTNSIQNKFFQDQMIRVTVHLFYRLSIILSSLISNKNSLLTLETN